MKVGTKRLKNQLSRYLHLARQGTTIYVTDRGKVVAQVTAVPAAARGESAIWRELAADGAVHLGDGAYRDFVPVRLKRGGKRASQMILEDRG
jgi:antitoxin (DNA-binding transcriptional repressor) of toxin-antitoxin stability system